MLRPATPLSVILAAAFILLLLSVLSTPVIQAIPLGSYQDVTFGVFGYCTADGCSSIGLGYDLDRISTGDPQAFDLPSGTRNTLSTILVLHPVAAFLTLIMVIMAAATHIHSASHSSRYLLVFFIFIMIDFLVCLAAFVVDLLLFLPHQAWGTYIVLAATILVFVCGVGSCAMRRTLISRKSRRRKVEDNADMNGQTYYNAGNLAPKPSFITSSQPTVPMVSGANGSPDTLPAFATFEHPKKDDQMSDEHIPLTQRTNSERSPPSMHSVPADMPPPGEVGVALGGPRRAASQDPYGNYTNGSPDPYGAARGSPYERMNRGGRRSTDPPANYRGGPNGAYVPPYMRGRGGYGQPGRGGYGPRGGRGGYGPSGRGVYGPGGMRGGGRSPPPPSHNNMAGPYDSRGPYPEPQAPYGSHPPPASDPSLNRNPSNGNGRYTAYTPNFGLPRAESPPPLPGGFPDANSNYAIGQAIEMDATPATTTSSTPAPAPYGQIRDNDTDVTGMIGLQQSRLPERPEPYVTAENHYQEDQYVPPRAEWNQAPGEGFPRMGSPPNVQNGPAHELAAGIPPTVSPVHNGNYYEDVDPRFDQTHNNDTYRRQSPPVETDYEGIRDAASGARSPAESDRSNFTSISQRGINPEWNPHPHPPMPQPPYGPPSRRPVQQRRDMLLDNPDFRVPGGKSGAGQRGPGGMIPGSAYPTGPL